MSAISEQVVAQYASVAAPSGFGVYQQPTRSILRLTGSDRASFLQGMVSNDIAALTPGHGCRAAFLDNTGHILADLEVHAFDESLLIESDPRCGPRLHQLLEKYLIMEDVEIGDVSGDWVILTVIGNGAGAVIERAGLASRLANLSPHAHTPLTPPPRGGEAGRGYDASGFIASMPHGSVPTFDLWLPVPAVEDVLRVLESAGAIPLGFEVMETLRVEAGLAVWGAELDESVLLPEAEMADAVSYTKGCYIGQEIVARIQARGRTNRMLRQIVFGRDSPVPVPGSLLHAVSGDEPGREIGRITSAVFSLKHHAPLALAYLRREYSEPGTIVDCVGGSAGDGRGAVTIPNESAVDGGPG